MPYTLNGEPLHGQPFTVADVQYSGIELTIWSHDGLLALPGMEWVEPEPVVQTVEQLCAAIDAMRNQRIDGGFAFNGARFQSRASDRENVMGAAQLALAYLGAGGDPDILRWADPAKDFEWITEDNSTVQMTAPTVVALFQAGIAFKSAQTFHARDLKDAQIAAYPDAIDITTGWP